MSVKEMLHDPSDTELDSETWSDYETLVGEENPEGDTLLGEIEPCSRPSMRTDLAMGVNPELQTKPQSERKESPTPNAKTEVLHSEPMIGNDKSPDDKWILNRSVRSGDGPDHEKSFVTYAQQPKRWCRVTVSCNYKAAVPDSLEADLKELPHQDDRGRQMYELIQESLLDIQFYDIVTNLRLQTRDDRLQIHVTEDVNEIIPYPPQTTVAHIRNNAGPMEVRESEQEFGCHLAGFVYKVSYEGKDYIKKEIPGPYDVHKFLYEANALNDLNGSVHVIRLEAVVVDDSRTTVKGLLIEFAQRGALVDLLYNHKGKIPWEDRMRWAQQAIQGLGQIQ